MNLLPLTKALQKYQVPYALIGGYAVVLHGVVRTTVDIDLLTKMTLINFINLEKALHSLGLVSRIPVTAQEIFHFRTEYIEKRNLIAWSFVNPKNPMEVVDIIITHDLNEFEVVRKTVQGEKISIVSIDGLIALKQESARPQDLEDIKHLRYIQKNEKT